MTDPRDFLALADALTADDVELRETAAHVLAGLDHSELLDAVSVSAAIVASVIRGDDTQLLIEHLRRRIA